MLLGHKSPEPTKQHKCYKHYIGLSSPLQEPLSPFLVWRILSAPDSDYVGISTSVDISSNLQTASLQINDDENKALEDEKLSHSLVKMAPIANTQDVSTIRLEI